MKKKSLKTLVFVTVALFALGFTCISAAFSAPSVATAAEKATMTRQGDTIWFGYYPQTKATDEEVKKMSASPDPDGYYTSGDDKFVKVTNADPKVHSETADTAYIPFDDKTQPQPGATYYFKLEPIEWKVMVDDEDNNAVKLVSRYYIDTHAWLTSFENAGYWSTYNNTLEGVPENTPANDWRYSEIRAWLNDGFLKTAFSEDERKSILLFGNKNTIYYNKDDESTVVYDYAAVGDRSDYDAAGDDGRPTDYCIVRGATWCYNKDHIYYWVNDSFPGFGQNTVRLYRHDEHNKCATVDSVEAVRVIMYVKRDAAKILTTEAKKEEAAKNWMLIGGIIAAVVGAVLAIPVMVTTGKKQKKTKQETGKDYKLNKKEVSLITPGLILLICGIVIVVLNFALFGGGFGAKLKPGIYVQAYEQKQQGNIAVIGKSAYRVNSDGTYNYAAVYDGDKTVWDVGGTWSQSGSTVTFRGKANPMYPNGYTITATVMDGGTSFGDSAWKFKLIN